MFDLFDFLGSLSENASSRALSFLFDSSREHGLGAAFFDSFIENVYRLGREARYRMSLRQSLELRGASTSVTTEWATDEGRRLDLLVRVFDEQHLLKAVVGIENKHWAIEQEEQVADYQKELVKRFPQIPHRVLIFLAPRGRPSLTAAKDCLCPHIPCSYQAVTSALAEVESRATGEVGVLVTSLKNHLDKTLEGSEAMSAKIRKLVHALYRDEKHRNAIKHILQNIPRLGRLVDGIQTTVEEHLSSTYPGEQFACETYPKTQRDRLQEMYFIPTRLRELTKPTGGFTFYYTLHPDRNNETSDIPDLGDDVVVQLLAWCESKDHRASVEALDVASRLPPTIGTPQSCWPQWKEIWSGKSYKLRDLGEGDIRACAELFIAAIDATFPAIVSLVDERFPSTNSSA